ncbi:MAG: UDP-2,3-diacylglucosamine diphosphatase, partial [Paramuribaculum sp.]|nr:UDP-2,3-diacylglucosamine diphosphatase [Paramuribaculum sp.]
MRNKSYFISDIHLGAKFIKNPGEHERIIVKWLESIREDAKNLFLLGDILDYWYEYKEVIPRGFIRFFGALARLADSGVNIVWFKGNHDIWIFDYLPNEIGLKVVDGSMVTEIDGKRFFMEHGDGVGESRPSYRRMRAIFRNRTCQKIFSAIHPRWTVPFAHNWSSHSRATATNALVDLPDSHKLVVFAKDYEDTHDHIDYFVFGH